MLGFIGGTGPEGLGLAARFAAAGEEILIGSRSADKAVKAAEKLKEKLPRARVRGVENVEAVEKSDVVFLTVPYKAQGAILESLKDLLKDKILVHVVVPLTFEGGMPRALPLSTSAAEEAQRSIPEARVVSTLKDMSAISLLELKGLDCDVIACSDHQDAKEEVMRLVEKIEGIRALDGGPLRNSRTLEAITPLLLFMNKRYGARACLKIRGL
ncbi:MAG: NADPH-dependent F420 reductase [Candidatus Hydrothermarchaeaceae archaeon]